MATHKSISREREDYDVFAPVTLRFSDQDPLNHINNVAIAALLEAGRVALLDQVFTGTGRAGFSMVLAHLGVDFLKEIRFPGTVDVGGRLVRAEGRKLVSHYAIFQNDTCCVVSECVNVFFDTQTRRSCEPPADVVARVNALLTLRRDG